MKQQHPTYLPAEYIRAAKLYFGDELMSDRELGERLNYSQQTIAKSKHGEMSDPVAMKIAALLALPAGQVLWAARTERERNPTVRKYLEEWALTVEKAMASSQRARIR